MERITTFDSTKEALLDLLRSIRDGKTQLPDFQRGWVWDDEHIRGLVASVSLSYPIGALMMLQTGNPNVRLQPRLIEGVDLASAPDPDRLILDGQQRLTSLFQSLFANRSVVTKDPRGKQIRRWYYLDIEKALNPAVEREDAIVALPEDRIIRNFRGAVIDDFSTPKAEHKAGLFPLCQIFDCSDWRGKFNETWDYDRDKIKLFDQFEKGVIKRFEQYQIPVIVLGKETPKEAVCQVFEKVNTGGVPLTVFELLTATFAADNFNLREDWLVRDKRLRKHRVLQSLENTDFLQTVTLLATYARKDAVTCKRRDILRLTVDEYKTWSEVATLGFEEASRFLHGQHIYSARDLPYRTQLVPLAAVLAELGDEAKTDGARKKLAQWYWCGVLGELYGAAVETRFTRDLPEVVSWIRGGGEPATVSEANFAPRRLRTLRSRNSAAYKGLSAVLMRDGGLDFRTGDRIDLQIYFDDKLDIHHIFPQDWCRKHHIEAGRYDSIINKTPLAAKTNRIISNNAPSTYLVRMEKTSGVDEARMDQILRSHVIEPSALRADDFETFFKAREEALLERIEHAMRKPIARDSTSVEATDFAEESEMDEIEV